MSSRSRPGQGGDLGHAETAGVVGQPHVTTELLAGLVERGPHQAEVLLRRVGAGEALAGRSLRDVVEQRLTGRADHRDHVGTLASRLLGLRDVLVDVSGRDDQVDPRLAWRVADPVDQPFAFAATAVDAAYAGSDLLAGGGTRSPCVAALGQPEPHRPGGGLLGQRLEVLGLATEQCVPDREGQAVLETDIGPDGVGEPVHPRRAVRVGPGEPGQAQRGALDRDRRVLLGELHDRPADLAREAARLADGDRVEVELLGEFLGRRHSHSLRSNRARTAGVERTISSARSAWPGT